MQSTIVDVATDIPVSGGGASDGDGDWNDCFIATAAYGTPLHPHLGLLREFRERYLRTSSAGLLFLSIYERYGPSLAALINQYDILRGLTRIALLPVLGLCILILHTGPLPLIAFSVALCVLVVYRVRRRRSLQEA